eukprot:gnl/MRDRNA2_/MRDRNA2_118522_c0_seq1.p1 gnl/MRDRNA2_/MRDRNA2_118522_c0~~gnl/MRDRNA2_/MRDRNA2_118522_c0_seq1.p1  ORF type:complete len:371 (-),score=49.10 gnl/MRDRNA2_/MRDRNA2_118522_c0_seq1:132-1244(-)
MKCYSYILFAVVATGLRVNSPGSEDKFIKYDGYNHKEIVFHAVAMGPMANFNQIQALVSSIRSVGGFHGSIVLTTDHPHCLEKNLQQSDLAKEVKIVTVNRTMDKNIMKAEKANVWKHIQTAGLQNVKAIVQIDTDMIIGSSLHDVLERVQLMVFSGEPPAIALFHDREHGTGPHTGVMVTFNTHKSALCLRDWKHNMAKMCITEDVNEDGSHQETCYCKNRHPGMCQNNGYIIKEELTPHCRNSCDRMKEHQVHEDRDNFRDIYVPKLIPEQKGSIEEVEIKQQVMFDQEAIAETEACMAGSNLRWLDDKFLLLPSDADTSWDATFIHATNTYRVKNGVVSSDTLDDYIRDGLHLTLPSYVSTQKCKEP